MEGYKKWERGLRILKAKYSIGRAVRSLLIALCFFFAFYAPIDLSRLILAHPVWHWDFYLELAVIFMGLVWLVYSARFLIRRLREW